MIVNLASLDQKRCHCQTGSLADDYEGGQQCHFLCGLEDVSASRPALLIQDSRSNLTHSPDEEPVTRDDITVGVT